MQFTGNKYIVAGVTLLIAYIAITSQVFVFIPWFWSISWQRTFQVLFPFNVGVFSIYWNYYLACTTEPGTTPPGWGASKVIEVRRPTPTVAATTTKTTSPASAEALESKEEGALENVGSAIVHTTGGHGHSTALDSKKSAQHLYQKPKPHPDRHQYDDNNNNNNHKHEDENNLKKKKKIPLPRFCRTCEQFKPPRSHHCRVCKKCVLKMDHHCPWINNCVGHFNYGHFIRFITWVTLTTGMCMVLLIWRILDAIQNEVYYMYTGTGPTKTQIIFMAVNIAVDGGVLLAVGVLTIYHFWSMISNTSTIEVWEQEKVEAMIKKGKLRKTKFPYDVGCFRNYRQVLGPRFWLWLWPQQMMGSGTEFEVTDDKDAALIWPPREYQTSKKQDRTFISEYTSSSIRQRRNRNLSSLGTPVSPKGVHGVAANDAKHEGRGSGGSKRRTRINSGGSGSSRGSTTAVPAPFPTHVRRGSEGWIVQDLTVQQRAELYDRQQQYQLQHPDHAADNDEEEDEEQEEYHEGLSDIEGHAYGGLPGGMQGSHDDYNDDEYNVAEQDERLERHQQRIMTSSSEDDDDDIPYDVISDEYDDDGYGDDDEEYHGDDDDLDEQNPYLAYADEDDEEEEEEEEEEQEYEEDEVTLHGQDRHKIGRFFDTMDPRSRQQDVDDEWDEGDGVDVGCRPPAVGRVQGMGGMDGASSLEYEPKQKTFYTMLVEREEALKKQQKHK